MAIDERNPRVGVGGQDTEIEDTAAKYGFEDGHLRLPMRGAVVDGRYDVVELIGEGGFGWVFKVKHRLLDRVFAMKILHPRIANDPSWTTRFREEAKTTSLIGHENIVFVTDFGHCESYGYYFTMEFLDGTPLSTLIAKQGPLPLQQTLKFALAAGSALSAVHDIGIVHCDLKPGNVMIVQRPNRDDFWKFLDFGTSTFVIDPAESEFVYGTPAYMAPEQAIGREVDHKADQFSLACIIYEMLTGRLPWPTEQWQDAFPENRRQHKVIPIHELRPDIMPEVSAIVERGFDLRRAYRWPSVEAFVEAMQATVALKKFVPRPDPQDLRLSKLDHVFVRSLSAPRVSMPDAANSQSMVILLEEPGAEDFDCALNINMVFRHAGRLRREWRRNLIGGAMFVPNDTAPDLRTPVVVNILYLPSHESVSILGTVVSHDRPDDSKELVGFGVGFDFNQQLLLKKFVRKLNLGLDLANDDVLKRERVMTEDDPLSAGEAYILSRLDKPTPVSRVRAYCSGLPFEFEDAIASLCDKGFLDVHQGAASSVSALKADTFPGTTPAVIAVSYSREERERALELIEFYRCQDNFMGALNVIQKAIAFAADEPEFHFQLAALQADFNDNTPAALRSLHVALRLNPNDSRFLELKARLMATKK